MPAGRHVGSPHRCHGFLETLREQPETEEARDLRIWAGRDFETELFDRRGANGALLRSVQRLGAKVTALQVKMMLARR